VEPGFIFYSAKSRVNMNTRLFTSENRTHAFAVPL